MALNTLPKSAGSKALLSRAEAAEHLGISVRTFDRIRQERPIPFVRFGQRKRKRYLVPDLDALIYDHRIVDESGD